MGDNDQNPGNEEVLDEEDPDNDAPVEGVELLFV